LPRPNTQVIFQPGRKYTLFHSGEIQTKRWLTMGSLFAAFSVLALGWLEVGAAVALSSLPLQWLVEAEPALLVYEVADLVPCEVPGAPLALGADFGCAVCTHKGRSTAVCFGANASGQLGRPPSKLRDPASLEARHEAKPVEGLRDVISVAAGPHNACAVTARGQLWCWGAALSAGTERARWGLPGVSAAPTRVVIEPVAQVFVERAYACAILTDRTVSCFGRVPSLSGGEVWAIPRRISGVEGAKTLVLEETVAFAITEAGPMAWGGNGLRQLGSEAARSPEGAAIASPGFREAESIALRFDATCALMGGARAGTVRCEGATPGIRQISLQGVAELVGGVAFCARSHQGRVTCFAAKAGASEPIQHDPYDVGVAGITALLAGKSFVCGVDGAGDVWCWGGRLGLRARRVLTGTSRVYAGGGLVCGTKAGARLRCIDVDATAAAVLAPPAE
jgi:hypothetical protein